MKKPASKNLIEAAAAGNLERVQALLAAGADVHAQKDMPLRWAAFKGRSEVVTLLLAAGKGRAEVVTLLLEHTADWPADALSKVADGPCASELASWRARQAIKARLCSVEEMSAP